MQERRRRCRRGAVTFEGLEEERSREWVRLTPDPLLTLSVTSLPLGLPLTWPFISTCPLERFSCRLWDRDSSMLLGFRFRSPLAVACDNLGQIGAGQYV